MPARPSNTSQDRLLFVEDEPLMANLLKQHFAKRGLAMVVMQDAESALEWLKKHKPYLILLDLVLPGMDGYDFLKALKADSQLSFIPVVVLSNLGREDEKKRAKELGAEAFIVKADSDLDEIFDAVTQRLKT